MHEIRKSGLAFIFHAFKENKVMSNNLSQQKRGEALESSDVGNNSDKSREGKQNGGAQEGEYKNIETSVNNRSYFGDDYEVEQEDEMSRNEANTEDENNVPNRKRPG